MTSTLPMLLLFVGLAVGAVLGWLAHAHAAARQQPSEEHRALSESQRRQAELAPLEKAMDRLGAQLQELEEDQATSTATLNNQVQAMLRNSARLTDRTDDLVSALRSPNVRGRWGEVQLERIVELGGMVKHVDFEPQATAYADDQRFRPDLVINLSGGRHIVVDAKVPFSSYLDALETKDPEEHAAYLRRHCNLVRNHVQQLSSKDYITAFSPTPEFVVLFMPADPFLDAALQVDPHLLEFAFERNLVIATPTTLFALLRTVALGWRQEDVSAKAREVQKLGSELYSRLYTLHEHYGKVGNHLEKAVLAYNSTLSSLDARVGVTARRLQEMEIPTRTDKQPEIPQPIDAWPRQAESD